MEGGGWTVGEDKHEEALEHNLDEERECVCVCVCDSEKLESERVCVRESGACVRESAVGVGV